MSSTLLAILLAVVSIILSGFGAEIRRLVLSPFRLANRELERLAGREKAQLVRLHGTHTNLCCGHFGLCLTRSGRLCCGKAYCF